jgi:hypothetical protein
MPAKKPSKKRPGKKPETLKIEGDWKDAVKRALQKPVPKK